MRVFCIDQTVNINILKSQLLAPLRLLDNNEFILLVPQKFKDVELFHSFTCFFYRSIINKVFFITKNNIRSIYTRSVFEFLIIYLLKFFLRLRFQITYDFRGIAFAESRFKNNNYLKYIILWHLEKFAYKKADKINTVSNKFKEFLINEFKYFRDITVIPCCISNFQLKDNSKPYNPTIKLVYLGSAAKWQKVDLVIETFERLQALIDCNLTIISNDKVNILKIINEKNINIEIKSLSHDQVYNELLNYDFGFLLRDNILLNNVSSPVKFLEYVANGVIPIISKGVGDYSDLVVQEGIGICYDGDIIKLADQILLLKNNDTIIDNLHSISSQYHWRNYYNNYRL